MLISICTAIAACSGNDPVDGKKGRPIGPRLSNARWEACCTAPEIVVSCPGSIRRRADAIALLQVAHGPCLDRVFDAIGKHAKDDRAAAYFIRAQRKNDAVDFLRALDATYDGSSGTALFNRALIQEQLGLTREAVQSWDGVVLREDSQWAAEAESHRDNLNAPPRWNRWDAESFEEALRRRDRGALQRMANAFPLNAIRYFEDSNILDFAASRLLADIFAQRGEHYPRDIVNAAASHKDSDTLARGLRAFRAARALELKRNCSAAKPAYENAAALLEEAGNPLALAARYGIASCLFISSDSRPLLEKLLPVTSTRGYRDLTARIHSLHASATAHGGDLLQSLNEYDSAIAFASGDPASVVGTRARKAQNYAYLGDLDSAFRESYEALRLLPDVADLNARHQAYASAAMAARQLGHPRAALQFADAAVSAIRSAVADAPAASLQSTKHHLGIALRERADLLVHLDRDDEAEDDLRQASELAAAADRASDHDLLNMRIQEVRGQALVKNDPRAAVASFTDAIRLANEQNHTYRAVLLFKRAAARREANDPRADDDTTEALRILREEAKNLRDQSKRGDYETLWTPYFSRFETMYQAMVERRIAQNDIHEPFVYAEQARAFEPMQLVLQSRSAPRAFRTIESVDDLMRHLDAIPDDTVILQYIVLKLRTYVWVLTRSEIELVPLAVGREKIERWVTDVHQAAMDQQSASIINKMIPAYEELFRVPLSLNAAKSRTRVVIVPDGPMHGLPFAAMRGWRDGYLIQRASLAIAGSTSLYLYALQRDLQFAPDASPSVLLIADPTNDLQYSRMEAMELRRDYGRAKLLLGGDATVSAFLRAAPNADLIQFGGHGIVNLAKPSASRLEFAPEGNIPGALTAADLMRELPELERTRCIILAACSSAGGAPVGPEGVAPIVRPILAANVPAVVGTLWKVGDATTRSLLVSFHCHYRNGDDVAVALQQAQLEMLRNPKREVSARTWAAFQVVGYAGSPFAQRPTMEKTHSEHVCSEDSLHRPHGLHSQ
jgi:CHAT domain-containing protein